MDKKLFIVSTRTIDTTLIAGWRNGSLRVQQVKTYKDLNDKDVQKIRGQMKLYRTKGFTAVANEPIARFAGDGIMSISLTDKDSNNIPRLTSALTAFKQLIKRGGISYAEGAKPIMVPETVYNETVNERGETSYVVDWEMLDERALALLTAIYCALNHVTAESNYLQAVFGHINKGRNPNLKSKLVGTF